VLDYIIVGAGPAGLACAIEAEKKGDTYLVLEKGCVVNSIYNFPSDMTFFSTPEFLQLGEMVFVTDAFRPTRNQVLHYYLRVAREYGLKIAQYHTVKSITRNGSSFKVLAESRRHQTGIFNAKKVILATGYYDNPNHLDIEGENLEKVSHYYTEAHPLYDQDVAVIGGKNSAVEATLAFYRAGARVTLIHRGNGISDSVKYWVKPDIEKRIEAGQIKAMFNTVVTRITGESVFIKNGGEEKEIKNDSVFALTGYHPDLDFLKECGVELHPETLAPKHNPDSLETGINGLYVAGSVAAGLQCNKIFIENGREHGKIII